MTLQNSSSSNKTVNPLVVITGPTASGKTSLAIKIAQEYNGEIISADSRAIYIGADIGTAKPSSHEQATVPHWGIDLVKPNQYYSVADFKAYADQKIAEIRNRGHLPILAGGTGLYIDSVLFDFQFGKKANKLQRYLLQHMSISHLQAYCRKHNIDLPENAQNKRYLIRSIEKKATPCSKQDNPVSNSIIVGIATDKSELRSRIESRAETFFAGDVINEALLLGKKYGWKCEAMKSNIYPIVRQYKRNELTLDQAKQKFVIADWRLAKRQLTWMRRNKFIHWLSIKEAEKYIIDQLATSEQL